MESSKTQKHQHKKSTTRTQNLLLTISFIFISIILLLSTSLTITHTATPLHSLTSRLLFAANYYIAPFALVSARSKDTCLVSDSTDSCKLSSVTAMERRSSAPERSFGSSSIESCDIFDGSWVLDSEVRPTYELGSCPFVDDTFNCFKNGRPDFEYLGYTWKPNNCQIPRFNGKKMLEILRRKRMVFVGDSLNRNMWQSLLCSLRESIENKSRIIQVHNSKAQGYYSYEFIDYEFSIEFIRSPFLVQNMKVKDKTGRRKERLRLDMIHGSSTKYSDADIIIFNTGHWWTHHKTDRGKDYFQEGTNVYSRLEVSEAYTKALSTWAKWVDSNINSTRSRVFFQGYSSSHFRKGQWNTGGQCSNEPKPITNATELKRYPWMMRILESVISEMKTPVFYLNITGMTDYRIDGHPSIYGRGSKKPSLPGMKIQDCSHWCLPGVPDSWNQIFYATLSVSSYNDI